MKPVPNLQTGACETLTPDESFLNRIVIFDECVFRVDENVNRHSAKIWGSKIPHETKKCLAVAKK